MDGITDKLLEYLPVILTVAGGFVWTKVSKILTALKESADLLTSIVVAFDDKEIKKEEIQQIKKEGIEAIAAIKAIFK